MIRCVVPRGSSTARWLIAANRSYRTSVSSSNVEQHGFSNTKLSATEQAASTDAENNTEGRKEDGTSTGTQDGKPRPHKRRELPLSPLMDPSFVAAREKHHLPKARSSKTPTIFQQQLSKNPYALALATPVRMCQMTRAILPNYFLQQFGLMAHPETSKPWWVPLSVRKKYGVFEDSEPMVDEEVAAQSPLAPEATSDATLELEYPDTGSATATNYPPIKQKSPLPAGNTPPNVPPKIGPNLYVLSRQTLIYAMQVRNMGYGRRPWETFGSSRMRQSRYAKKLLENATWRLDMNTFILKLMRRRVVEGLIYLVQRKRGFVAGCVGWEDAKMSGRQAGMILWTGKMRGEEEDLTEVEYEELAQEGPPECATLVVGTNKKHQVPVHNLPMLLGEEHMEELRNKCPIFEKEVLIVRDKRSTVDVQMKLWRLQGYIGFREREYDSRDYILKKVGRRGRILVPRTDDEVVWTPAEGQQAIKIE